MEVYADHAATTPVDPRVLEAMVPFYTRDFYNPSSLYRGGREVHRRIEECRELLAAEWGCQGEEIFFTSGGTEGDNLAVLGAVRARKGKHLVVSAIEHHAVLEAAAQLEKEGVEVTYLPCGPDGRVRPQDLREAMTPHTALVSVMWANNESGALQPVEELCAIAHEGGALFHTDAVQALGTQKIRLDRLPADLLTVSSHKVYGPKGVGALFVRKGTPLQPLQFGGQQERKVRGGTENPAGIAGFAQAVRLLGQEREDRCRRQAQLAQKVLEELGEIPGMRVNTPLGASVPGVLNLSFAGVEAEPLLICLGMAGICASMGAACNSQTVEPSYVLREMGVPDDYIRGSVRLSLGKDNTQEDAVYLARQLTKAVSRLRR